MEVYWIRGNCMFKNFSPRLFFSMAAIACLIISPLFAIFVPIILIDTLFKDDTKLFVYSFGTSASIIIIAFAVFAGASMLQFWKRTALTAVASILIVLLGFTLLYSTSQIYTVIDSEKIVFKKFITEKSLDWADVKEVTLEFVPNDLGEHIFTTVDGKEIVMKENKFHVTSYIYNTAREKNIPYNERPKK